MIDNMITDNKTKNHKKGKSNKSNNTVKNNHKCTQHLAYGEGSHYYDDSHDKFVAQFNIETDDGKKRRTVYADSELEVIRKMDKEKFLAQQGVYNVKNKITVYDMGYKIIDREYQLNHIKPTTYDRKCETLKLLSPLYSIPIQKITEDDIYDFLVSITHYSQSVINKVFLMLGCIFREAVKKKIITKNPMDDVKKPKSNQKFEKVRALTVKEQKKLTDILTSNDILYSEQMILSMFTGMRMGEINALEVNDIDLINNRITIGKTVSRGKNGKTVLSNCTKTKAGMRKIPISDEIAYFLREYIDDQREGLLFTSSNGKYVTTNQVNSQFANVIKKHHILDDSIDGKVSLHSLRHTYATRCIESGMSAKVLQSLLGHKDISITLDTYCDVFQEFSNEKIAIANDYMRDNGLSIH